MKSWAERFSPFLDAKPAGISPQDAAYVNAAVVLVNQFVSDYKALHPDAT